MKTALLLALVYIVMSLFVTAYIVVRDTFDKGFARRVSTGTALLALPTFALVLGISWLICKVFGFPTDDIF